MIMGALEKEMNSTSFNPAAQYKLSQNDNF